MSNFFYIVTGIFFFMPLVLSLLFLVLLAFYMIAKIVPKKSAQGLRVMSLNKLQLITKFKAYSDKLKHLKVKFQGWILKMPYWIPYVCRILTILAISLIFNISGNCQKDTLKKGQIDSLTTWIGFINTDLLDYDLVKQKSSVQGETIKGLRAISYKKDLLSNRKETKLDLFSMQIIGLQAQNFTLQAELSKTKRKALRRGFLNVLLGSSTIFLTFKFLTL